MCVCVCVCVCLCLWATSGRHVSSIPPFHTHAHTPSQRLVVWFKLVLPLIMASHYSINHPTPNFNVFERLLSIFPSQTTNNLQMLVWGGSANDGFCVPDCYILDFAPPPSDRRGGQNRQQITAENSDGTLPDLLARINAFREQYIEDPPPDSPLGEEDKEHSTMEHRNHFDDGEDDGEVEGGAAAANKKHAAVSSFLGGFRTKDIRAARDAKFKFKKSRGGVELPVSYSDFMRGSKINHIPDHVTFDRLKHAATLSRYDHESATGGDGSGGFGEEGRSTSSSSPRPDQDWEELRPEGSSASASTIKTQIFT